MHTLAVLMSFLHTDWRGHNLSRCCFKTPGPSLNVGNVSSRRQSTLPNFFLFFFHKSAAVVVFYFIFRGSGGMRDTTVDVPSEARVTNRRSS